MPPCINKIIPSPIIAENVPFVAPLQEIHEKFTVGRCVPKKFSASYAALHVQHRTLFLSLTAEG